MTTSRNGAESAPHAPVIVGIGGTTRPSSSSETVLKLVLSEAAALGAETVLIGGAELLMPLYAPESADRDPKAIRLIAHLRRADAVVIASPGYHGGVSGLVKNALDYTEDLREDNRPYLDGRAVGCIVSAQGWQATGTTLTALRSIIHALRGWPTPAAITINSGVTKFDSFGRTDDRTLQAAIALMAKQVVGFANANWWPSHSVGVGQRTQVS